MKTATSTSQRSVEYNVFVGTPEVLFEFYTEINKLTGLPRYRHMGRARMVHIFQEIVMKTRKKHVEMGANMILADLMSEKKIVH